MDYQFIVLKTETTS